MKIFLKCIFQVDVRDSAAVKVALDAAAFIKVQAIISDPPGISSNI